MIFGVQIVYTSGMKNLSKVRTFTPEYRKKISDTLKRKGIRPPSRLGVRLTEEQRKKHAQAFKGVDMSYWKIGKTPKRGKAWEKNVVAGVLKTRKTLAESGRLTNLEKIIDVYLHKNYIKHEHEYKVGGYAVDFYLPKEHEILEADSDYWHLGKDEDKRDQEIMKLLPGVNIIHLTEEALIKGTWLEIWGARRGV